MNKILRSFLPLLGTLLCILALPSLSPADPTPAASGDDAALAAKVNKLYYNYKTLGLNKMACRVQVSALDKMLQTFRDKNQQGDPRYKALKDVRFFTVYTPKDGFNFNYTGYQPTGDSTTDAGLAKMLDGIQKIVEGFWKGWSSITLEPAIDTDNTTLAVTQTSAGWEIDEQRNGDISKNLLDSGLLITEVDGYKAGKPDVAAIIKPGFVKTSNGYLLDAMNVEIPQTLTETISIDYKDILKFRFPTKAELMMNVTASGTHSDITLQFVDYQVN
jgi:hypothetical protein